jgi:serine/threonine-protein kinase
MERKTCPSCGAGIEADHPGGLCAACLLNEGLRTEATMNGPRLRCPACQSALGEDARFCARCGAPAPAEPAATGDVVRAALEAKLQAQYRVVRLLGRGGMGSVYLARDLTLDREVAIKVVRTDSDAGEIHDRLRREARTAARLSHPNIVPLHAFGEVEGMPYFVMGYVRGESLATRLRRDSRLPEDEARRILADVAEALDHAHRQGVVHRDVKPDNVLLDDESGRALLTDFGVAKALGGRETLTAHGSVVGTPHYMSPEQAAGRGDIDGRSDLYSLGVMAYAMLTGRAPFDGKTPADVLAKHLTQEPAPLRSLVPMLSDSTLQAVERCLAKDPIRRWPDARSLRQALGSVAPGSASLPEALEQVESQGFRLVLWTLAAGLLAEAWWLWWSELGPGSTAVMGILSTVVLAAMIGAARRPFAARAQGVPWPQIVEVAFWPPRNWACWYPRRRRRPHDVWDRLPASARLVRVLPAVWMSFSVVIGPLAVIGISPAYDLWSGTARQIVDLVYVVTFPLSQIAFWAGVVAPVWPWLRIRRLGLSGAETLRLLLTEPTARPAFWAKPHIAAILSPATRTETARRSDSPHDQLQSILRNADDLSGALRPLGSQAAVAGRQLLVAIEQADRAIAELARSVDAGEEERLVQKIAALGDASAPMRQLLSKQLDLVRELSARLQEARDERSRKVELLKTLALHVASLRARSAEAPGEVPSLSERVRALCDEIGGQALALGEVKATERTSTFAPAPRGERTDS